MKVVKLDGKIKEVADDYELLEGEKVADDNAVVDEEEKKPEEPAEEK
jgi:hypothetical protein